MTRFPAPWSVQLMVMTTIGLTIILGIPVWFVFIGYIEAPEFIAWAWLILASSLAFLR